MYAALGPTVDIQAACLRFCCCASVDHGMAGHRTRLLWGASSVLSSEAGSRISISTSRHRSAGNPSVSLRESSSFLATVRGFLMLLLAV